MQQLAKGAPTPVRPILLRRTAWFVSTGIKRLVSWLAYVRSPIRRQDAGIASAALGGLFAPAHGQELLIGPEPLGDDGLARNNLSLKPK